MFSFITKEVKIALLAISAITLFVLGFNYMKGKGVFSSSREFVAEYDHVQGLTPASFVQLQGFTIGTVKDIELSKEHPGKIKVILAVDKDVFIPSDSKASIISADLLGTKAVSITLGQSKTQAANNSMLEGEQKPGAIESLSQSAGPVMDNAKNTLLTLDQTLQQVKDVLDEPTRNHLKSATADLSKTLKDFSQFAAELNGQRQKLTVLISQLTEFSSSLNQQSGTITRILNNTEGATANLKKADLEGTIRELKTTLNDLHTTLDKINHGNGSMALLMNDDKLYRNLKNTLATTNNLLADINARPSRYINLSVFGRKSKSDCPPPQAPNAND